MKIKYLMAITLAASATAVYADLTPWKDYEPSQEVWIVTTVKVDANMDDAYLEGLRGTWIASNEVAKKLGQIEDYRILRSDLPQSGHFNLLLMTKFKNNDMLAPSKARYETFMKEWGEDRNREVTEYAQKNYPGMRKITGSYQMREIKVK